MPRKGPVSKCPLVVDPVYGSPVVAQFVNRVLLNGKKFTVKRIVYGILEGVHSRMDQDPVSVLKRALDGIHPALGVCSHRVDGATYQVPVEVRPGCATTLTLRWLVDLSRQCRRNTMIERLMNKILDTSDGLDTAVKRREDVHRMAESNKASVRYRWWCRNQLHTPHGQGTPPVALDVLTDLTEVCSIGIMAHIDTGKTTVAEHILFYTGISYKIGGTHDGASTMDWMEQEQGRGTTITSVTTTYFWKNNQIDIIDTLGHVGFTVGAERSLRVLDGAVAVFNGKEDVEPQSETVWHQADKYNVSCICYIGKMDKLGADLNFFIQTIRDRLHAILIVFNFPIGAEDDSSDLVDILRMQTIRFSEKSANGKETRGSAIEYEEIPSELVTKVKELCTQLVEAVAEADDVLMEKYLEGKEFSIAELEAGIRKLTVTGETFPVLTGSTFRNKGIQPVLDAVLDHPPSPLGVPSVEGYTIGNEEEMLTRPADEKVSFSVLTFKVATYPFYDELIYVHVYSDKVSQGEMVLDATKGKKERIGKLFRIHSNKENPVKETHAGHTYTFIGLKDVIASDILCVQGSLIVLESMTLLAPVIHVAVGPKTKGGQEKLGVAIQKFSKEDPTFAVSLDEETGQTVIGGVDEPHLDVFVDRMHREFKIETNVGAPRVAYRETTRRKVDKVEYTHKKQTDGFGQFVKVQMSSEPLVASEAAETADGGKTYYEFANTIIGDCVPHEYIPSVDAGAQDIMLTGVPAGYPMVDIKTTLIDDTYHEIDSSEMASKIVGPVTFKEGVKKASPVPLEPVMVVKARTPEEYVGDIIGGPNSRRGMIASMEDAVDVKVIHANVPLSEMFGYIGDLRSKAQGRAVYSVTLDSHAGVSRNVADKIITKAKGA